MKKFLLIFLSLMIFQPAFSKIITGEIEYNAEDAKNAVFSSPFQPISFNNIQHKLIDSNNSENLNSLYLGITKLKDRKLARFSDGSYGIQYYDDPMYSWYYSQNGRLINFTQKDSLSYPCKITKYKPDGSIANTGYRISDKESFIFSSEGKLIAHWKNNTCYDESGNIIMTRKITE